MSLSLPQVYVCPLYYPKARIHKHDIGMKSGLVPTYWGRAGVDRVELFVSKQSSKVCVASQKGVDGHNSSGFFHRPL